MRKQNTLILFAKFPKICRVKTRLWPDLNHRECLDLHKSLTTSIIRRLKNSNKYNFITYTTAHNSPLPSFGITSKQQYGHNLGARMHNAITQELKYAQRVVLIGSDCIELSRESIETAFDLLSNQNDITLGPTQDGGYCLIGMKQPCKFVFENITWSTPDVLNQTLRVGKKKSKKIHLLETMHDIDTIDDLIKLKKMSKLPDWAGKFARPH